MRCGWTVPRRRVKRGEPLVERSITGMTPQRCLDDLYAALLLLHAEVSLGQQQDRLGAARIQRRHRPEGRGRAWAEVLASIVEAPVVLRLDAAADGRQCLGQAAARFHVVRGAKRQQKLLPRLPVLLARQVESP